MNPFTRCCVFLFVSIIVFSGVQPVFSLSQIFVYKLDYHWRLPTLRLFVVLIVSLLLLEVVLFGWVKGKKIELDFATLTTTSCLRLAEWHTEGVILISSVKYLTYYCIPLPQLMRITTGECIIFSRKLANKASSWVNSILRQIYRLQFAGCQLKWLAYLSSTRIIPL